VKATRVACDPELLTAFHESMEAIVLAANEQAPAGSGARERREIDANLPRVAGVETRARATTVFVGARDRMTGRSSFIRDTAPKRAYASLRFRLSLRFPPVLLGPFGGLYNNGASCSPRFTSLDR